MKSIFFFLQKFFSSPETHEFEYVEVNRNDKCYCGSGKKYKNCHLPQVTKRHKRAFLRIDKSTGEMLIKTLSEKKIRKSGLRPRGVYELNNN